jgi:LmbE family N-acetylglucosaminyl deacetylase
MKQFLYILPHPDDGEVLTPHMIQHSVNLGYKVFEHLSCCDEYGTTRVEWKGNKIQRIRRAEMGESAKVYYYESKVFKEKTREIHPITVIWGPYIDGHVPHNKESIEYYRNLILNIRPDAIFIPDPFFPVGLHNDHIISGLSSYLALKSLAENVRP